MYKVQLHFSPARLSPKCIFDARSPIGLAFQSNLPTIIVPTTVTFHCVLLSSPSSLLVLLVLLIILTFVTNSHPTMMTHPVIPPPPPPMSTHYELLMGTTLRSFRPSTLIVPHTRSQPSRDHVRNNIVNIKHLRVRRPYPCAPVAQHQQPRRDGMRRV